MKYVYMNEFIGQTELDVPPIAVWDPTSLRLVYAEQVEIRDRAGDIVAIVRSGQKPPKDMPHDATAWVEIFDGTGNGNGKVTFF